jgi:hypothetical protein
MSTDDVETDALANDLAAFSVTKKTVVGKLRRVSSTDGVILATEPRSALATCVGTASILASETPREFSTPETSECDEYSSERALRDATVTTRYVQRSLHQSLKSLRHAYAPKTTKSLDESTPPPRRRSMQQPLESISEGIEGENPKAQSLGNSEDSTDTVSEGQLPMTPDDVALHVFGGSRLTAVDAADNSHPLIVRETLLNTAEAAKHAAVGGDEKYTKIFFNPDPQARAKWQIFVVPNSEISEQMLFALITAQLSDELDPLRMCNCKAASKRVCTAHPPPDMTNKIVACYTLDAGLAGIRQTDLKNLVAQHTRAGTITQPGLWRRYRLTCHSVNEAPVSRTFKFKMFFV